MSAEAVGRAPRRGSGSGAKTRQDVEIRGSRFEEIAQEILVAVAYHTSMATDRSREVKRGGSRVSPSSRPDAVRGVASRTVWHAESACVRISVRDVGN